MEDSSIIANETFNIFAYLMLPNAAVWFFSALIIMYLVSYKMLKVPSGYYSPYYYKFIHMRNITLAYMTFSGLLVGFLYGIIPVLKHHHIVTTFSIKNPIEMLPYSLAIFIPALIMLNMLHRASYKVYLDYQRTQTN